MKDQNSSANLGQADESFPRRLRRLHQVWPDRDGNISYLLTICVDGRRRVLDNDTIFERLAGFLLDSPQRYHWFGRRFVIMPDHIHLIAHQSYIGVPLGQWIKALKAVVGGLEHRASSAGAPDGPVTPVSPVRAPGLQRIVREWRWQDGFHDHKLRTIESEGRQWEYLCLNPVRAKLVDLPEQWPYAGEIFYDEAGGPRLVRGTPRLLENAILIDKEPPREGTRPTP